MTNDNEMLKLTEMETDVIGEVMNISMGAAATAMSTILDKKVSITTPRVQTLLIDEFEFSYLEPVIGVLIRYIEGVDGTNILLLREEDLKRVLGHLLAVDSADMVELDEISMSAICEIMNQMMGSAASALATFLGQPVNISPPEILDTTENVTQLFSLEGDYLVSIKFNLSIDGLVESEFLSAMDPRLAKEIVKRSYGVSEMEEAQGAPAAADMSAASAADAAPGFIATDMPAAGAAAMPDMAAMSGAAAMQDAAAMQGMATMPGTAAMPGMGTMPGAAAMPGMGVMPGMGAMPGYQPAGVMPPMQEIPAAAAAPQATTVAAQVAAAAMQAGAQAAFGAGAYAAPMTEQAPKQQVQATPYTFKQLGGLEKTIADLGIDDNNLELIMSVPIQITVELGKTKKKIKDIAELTVGNIVELNRQAGDQVDVMANGRLIARGDVVVVDDNYSVRITEIVKAKDTGFNESK